jgi:hypothetical protein
MKDFAKSLPPIIFDLDEGFGTDSDYDSDRN